MAANALPPTLALLGSAWGGSVPRSQGAQLSARTSGRAWCPRGVDQGITPDQRGLRSQVLVYVRHGAPTSGRLLLVVPGDPFPALRGEIFARWAGH